MDSFWIKLIKDDDSCSYLSKVIKHVCFLSHGKSNLERVFSVNSKCIVENMQKELLMERKIVYDTILSIARWGHLDYKG